MAGITTGDGLLAPDDRPGEGVTDTSGLLIEDAARDRHLSDVLAAARARGLTTDHAWFVGQYVADVSDDDLAAMAPDDVAGLVMSHLDLARERRPGHAAVRVLDPRRDTDGWTTGHAVLEIVTDDMPFLVDSVSNELTRRARDRHLLIHPQVVVRRGPDGRLDDLVTADRWRIREAEDGSVYESWMHVQIDRSEDPADDAELVAAVLAVLADVRAAVSDWEAMRTRALRIAADLETGRPRGVDPEELQEGARLLHWLAEDHFTFIGYRDYVLDRSGPSPVLRAREGTGLGIMREAGRASSAEHAIDHRFAAARAPGDVVVLTKAGIRSTVHRGGHLDYVGVAMHDGAGRVVGEHRFLGLYSDSAYTQSVRDIPVAGRKVRAVLGASGHDPRSHSGKDLLHILETYPRDELLATDVLSLHEVTTAVQQTQRRRRTRAFVRVDGVGRFVSCLVYLPRDRSVTDVRLAIQEVLTDTFDATGIEHSVAVSEAEFALMHFVVRLPEGTDAAALARDLDESARRELTERVAACTRTWEEDLATALRGELGEARGARAARRWAPALPESYKEQVDPASAVADLVRLDLLQARQGAADDLDLRLSHPGGAGPTRLTLYRREALSLSALLPFFDNLGVEVVDQRPFQLGTTRGSTTSYWMCEFGLRLPDLATDPGTTTDPGRLAARFTDALVAAWTGTSESDRYDRLVLRAGLSWRQVVVLRTYGRYLRQSGTAFSDSYIAEALAANPEVARYLVNVFETRFHPHRFAPGPRQAPSRARLAAQARAADAVRESLDAVSSLAHDTILRSLLACMEATERTNFYRPGADGRADPTVALKLSPRRLPLLPQPRPAHEIFVCGPRVEGVHLRFGAVARGGLRWSDRREDFRTEVLGLVKAQQVKNAVIVPTGAKGGFVPKQLPDPAGDRDAWYAEGVGAYQLFVSAMLDVTDDRDPTAGPGAPTIPAPDTVRHDGDDAYLVVAADKGTAALSDIANGISQARRFWLGDAFASGGSHGYDHKAMGITARGAWESVRRHFRELGIDVDTDPFTVVGIGDMSGDVFGNGMLLSRSLRLVAAFDHRHVFIDPDPDPERSYAERQRLFALPRSSWADYDPEVISPGGGVWRRDAKSIDLPAPAARALGLGDGPVISVPPLTVLRAVLQAPVDLLWNGGIGTYVKSGAETHGDVGDKANDALRIDAGDLRVKVVGEGGNLGLTQRGRVAAAQGGVRLNTDAIDNSAGVDCSDHEVNIKILLDRVVADGDLDEQARDELLVAMTDDVAAAVLRHNVDQNAMLGAARHHARGMLAVHQRFTQWLADNAGLDPRLEALPDEEELAARRSHGTGLTGPELAVLSAYAKQSLTEALLASEVPDEAWPERYLVDYFPEPLRHRWPQRIAAHPLRREIIATRLANRVVDTCGITFVFRLNEELAVPADRAVRAWAVAGGVFGLDRWHRTLGELAPAVPSAVLDELRLTHRRVLDRTVRWLLQSRPEHLDVPAETARFAPVVSRLSGRVVELLGEAGRMSRAPDPRDLIAAGVPEDLAVEAGELLDRFKLLDVVEISQRTGEPAEDVLGVYLDVVDRYDIDPLLTRVSAIPRTNRWQSLARAALRWDVYSIVEAMTTAVVETGLQGARGDGGTAGPMDRVRLWERDNTVAVGRARAVLAEIASLETDDIAPLFVALRSLRSLVRTGSADGAR